MIAPLPLDDADEIRNSEDVLIKDDLIDEINELLENLPEFVGV